MMSVYEDHGQDPDREQQFTSLRFDGPPRCTTYPYVPAPPPPTPAEPVCIDETIKVFVKHNQPGRCVEVDKHQAISTERWLREMSKDEHVSNVIRTINDDWGLRYPHRESGITPNLNNRMRRSSSAPPRRLFPLGRPRDGNILRVSKECLPVVEEETTAGAANIGNQIETVQSYRGTGFPDPAESSDNKHDEQQDKMEVDAAAGYPNANDQGPEAQHDMLKEFKQEVANWALEGLKLAQALGEKLSLYRCPEYLVRFVPPLMWFDTKLRSLVVDVSDNQQMTLLQRILHRKIEAPVPPGHDEGDAPHAKARVRSETDRAQHILKQLKSIGGPADTCVFGKKEATRTVSPTGRTCLERMIELGNA